MDDSHVTIEGDETGPAGETAPSPAGLTGPLLCAFVTAGAWFGAWMLPAKAPIGAGLDLWRGFALALLRDVLIAGGCIAVGVGVSCLRYRWVVRLERGVWSCDRRVFLLATAVVGVALCVWIAYFRLQAVPHVPDEAAMLFQARNFARGQFYAPAPPKELAKFFAYEYILMDGPRWYGKYFAGPSLVLLPGVWLGVPWLMNPLLGGVAVVLFYALGKELFGEKAGRAAAMLAAVSPYRIGVYSVMMAHGGCLLLAMLFALYAIRAARSPQRYRYWVIAGVSLGAMIHFRPLTALVLAIPIGLAAVLMCCWREWRVESMPAFLLPVVVCLGAYFAYNWVLTGDPMLSAFEKWSPTDRLGFGKDLGMKYWPTYDRGHDLANVNKNLYLNLDAVALNLLGWGRATLLLMAAAFLVRGTRGRQLLCLAPWLALIVAYSLYHFSGALITQARYWSEAMGFMMLMAVGGLAAVRIRATDGFRRFGWRACDARARSAVWIAALGLTIWNGIHAMPRLADEFGPSMLGWTQAPALKDTLRRQPLTHALVFLPTTASALDNFTLGITMNNPNLDGNIIYARDLGDEQNQVLRAHYPDREAYRFIYEFEGPSRFEPLPAASSRPHGT